MVGTLTKWVDIPRSADARGDLMIAELGGALKFTVKRAYWIQKVPGGVSRGYHAHKKLHQLCICLQGSVRIKLFNGKSEESAVLNTPTRGLAIGPGLWREMHDFSSDCILLVLADSEYDESDYIRDKETFIRHVHSSSI